MSGADLSSTPMCSISVEMLRDIDHRFDLYARHGESGEVRLYQSRDVPLTDQALGWLREHHISTLFVSTADFAVYEREVSAGVLKNDEIPVGQRIKVLKEMREQAFEEAFCAEGVGGVVDFAEGYGRQMVDIACEASLVVDDIFSLMDHDNKTFTHCTNVSLYCLLLATHLGIQDEKDLSDLATAGLLHDVGKRDVELRVLNKPGPLTPEERKHIERHPQAGFNALAMREDVTWPQLMAVYQHHERIDGLGYPVQLAGDDIHPWARICAIADVFHALTSTRPYRTPLSPGEANHFVAEHAGTQFDKEMARCWTALVK